MLPCLMAPAQVPLVLFKQLWSGQIWKHCLQHSSSVLCIFIAAENMFNKLLHSNGYIREASQIPVFWLQVSCYNIVACLRHTRIVTSKHAPWLRNRRRSGVFSVPCRAEPKRAKESQTNPAVNESPGNRCKRPSMTREESRDRDSSDVTA
jgi:hypothetical protein